jgi:hypothetical protein
VSHDALQNSRRIDALGGEFESSWSGGQRVRIEAVVAEADPDDRASLLAELIALEFELRTSAGETVPLVEYQERFPDDADAVAEAILRISAADAFQVLVAPRDRLQSSVEAERLLLGDRLGAGGMGVVFRGRDRQLDRDLAVKVLADGLQSRHSDVERFVREARVCARCNIRGSSPSMKWDGSANVPISP